MSVLNICFAQDRIDLLSDTLQYAGGKPAGLCDRKVSLSDRFAWCMRGRCWLGDTFTAMAEHCANLDEAEVAAARWIDAIPAADLAGHNGMEVTIAGYSARSGDLAVVQFTREHGKPVEVKTYDRGVYLLPSRQGTPPLPATVTEAQFHRLALAQHAASKIGDARGMDGMCIGGVAHHTTITKAATSQRIAFLYPDYAEHRGVFDDPNAAEVARFLNRAEAVAA